MRLPKSVFPCLSRSIPISWCCPPYDFLRRFPPRNTMIALNGDGFKSMIMGADPLFGARLWRFKESKNPRRGSCKKKCLVELRQYHFICRRTGRLLGKPSNHAGGTRVYNRIIADPKNNRASARLFFQIATLPQRIWLR